MKRPQLYKQLIALLFLAAFFTKTMSKSFLIADYYTNTAKYAKNCVNKAKPKLQCKGKCQMMKKMKEEEKKDEQNPERKAENKNEVLLSSKSFFASVDPNILQLIRSKKIPVRSNNTSTDRSLDFFHPPQAC